MSTVTTPAKSGETSLAAMAVAHVYGVGYTVAAAIFLGAAVITGLLLRKHAPQAGNPMVAPVPEPPAARGRQPCRLLRYRAADR